MSLERTCDVCNMNWHGYDFSDICSSCMDEFEEGTRILDTYSDEFAGIRVFFKDGILVLRFSSTESARKHGENLMNMEDGVMFYAIAPDSVPPESLEWAIQEITGG